MTALALTLLRWIGALLNASAALVLFALILMILAQGGADGLRDAVPALPVLPLAPDAGHLPDL